MDLLRLVVEDRALDRPLEELVGVAAEELVERVLAGHVHREPGLAAAGAPPHLAQARHRAGEGHAQGGVEVADVDAELERVGRHDGEQVPLREPQLDLAPLRRRVARAVGGDPLRQVGAPGLLEPLPREALDQLHAAARLQEADRAHLALDELGEEVRRLRERGGAPAEPLVDERRVPHRDLALGARARRRGRPARARGRSAARPARAGWRSWRWRARSAARRRRRARAGAGGAARWPRASRRRRGTRAPRPPRPRRGWRARRPRSGGSAARPRAACPGS